MCRLPAAVLLAALVSAAPARAESPTPPPRIEPIPAPPAQVRADEGWMLDAVPAGPAPPAPAMVRHVRPLTPLGADLAILFERQRERLMALKAELARATDPTQALAIQRRVERDKQETEIEMLRVQAVHARRTGHAALVRQLEAAIAEQLQPPARLEPLARPLPARDDAR